MPTTSNVPTPAGCPTIQPNSVTIAPKIASDPRLRAQFYKPAPTTTFRCPSQDQVVTCAYD